MLTNETKKFLLESDVMKQRENWLLVAYVFNVEMFMGNALLWKQGYRSFKVDRISCSQVMKSKLIIIL